MKIIKKIYYFLFLFLLKAGSALAVARGCIDASGCIEGVGCPDDKKCFDPIGCPDANGCFEGIGCPNPTTGCYDLPVFIGGGMDWGLKVLETLIPGTGIINNSSLSVVILAWVKFFLILAGLIAFIAFLWAGAMYLTSFTNEENAEKGKKVMIYTAIGIIVILMSYVLVNLFINAAV